MQRSRKARVAALPSGLPAVGMAGRLFLESPHHLFDGDFLFYTLLITIPDNNLEVVFFDFF